MYITKVLNLFNTKVKDSLFPFLASLGYKEYYHTVFDEYEAYSKFEFKKGKDYISVYLGLNRLDYNDGIQVSLYTLGGVHQSLNRLINTTNANLYFGYNEDEIDHSFERIKDCLTKVLCRT